MCDSALTPGGAFCSNRQMPEPEVRAVADNLLQALRFFGHARASSEIQDLAGVSLIFCGLNYAAFNAALLSRPVEGDGQVLSRLIQLAAQRFDARNLRWTCWVCEDFLSRPALRDADRIFSRYGLRPLTQAPGMYTRELLPPHRKLPRFEIRPVADAETRKAFAEIMSVAFEIPAAVCTAVYGSEFAWTGDLRGYVGFENGKAVTTAAATLTGDVIGLYSVATVPAFRRMGYAEAIMRQVIEQAGARGTVLQSTRSGLSLYERMGYRMVTNFNVYIAD
jgi:GNAT superfamily N-acetyltransferase